MDFEFGNGYEEGEEYPSPKSNSQDSDSMDSDLENKMLGYLHYNGVTVVNNSGSRVKKEKTAGKAQEINSLEVNSLEEGEILESDASDDGSDDQISMVGFETTSVVTNSLTVIPNFSSVSKTDSKELEVEFSFPLGPSASNSNRYFVDSKGKGFTCYFCNKVGHIKEECPDVLKCQSCGSSRVTTQDPQDYRCHNCKFKVTSSLVNRDGSCRLCYKYDHETSKCSAFWRIYEFDAYSCFGPEKIYCSKCGYEGHFGEDCSSISKVQKSAFSRFNLPPRHLINKAGSGSRTNKQHALFTTDREENPWLKSNQNQPRSTRNPPQDAREEIRRLTRTFAQAAPPQKKSVFDRIVIENRVPASRSQNRLPLDDYQDDYTNSYGRSPSPKSHHYQRSPSPSRYSKYTVGRSRGRSRSRSPRKYAPSPNSKYYSSRKK